MKKKNYSESAKIQYERQLKGRGLSQSLGKSGGVSYIPDASDIPGDVGGLKPSISDSVCAGQVKSKPYKY